MEKTLNQAINAHKQGKIDEAERLYLEILKVEPKNGDANHNLGVLKVYKNDSIGAIPLFKTATEIKPNIVQFWVSYAGALINEKKFKQAELSCRKIIKLKSDFPNAYSNLGNILKKIGKFNEAEINYKKAIVLNPNLAEDHYNLGNTLVELGKLDEVEICFKKAIKIKPDFAQAYNSLGIRLVELNRAGEAEIVYKKAIKVKPNYPEAYNNLGIVQKLLGKIEDSLISYNHAYSLKPDINFLLGTLLHVKMYLCIWDDLTKNLNELIERIHNGEKVSPPFPMLSLLDEPNLQKKTAEIFSVTEFPKSNIFSKITYYDNHQKIRVGYFSADFKNHPVSRLIAELFETHDRKKFEIHAFSFGLETQDEFNIRIKKGVDYFHSIQAMSDYEVVKLTRYLEIDIAIDLSGFTGGNRQNIFAMLAAPIQVNYLGYPGTMGIDYMDYLIADNVVIPKKMKNYYSEKIVYMPNSYQPNLSQRKLSKNLLSRKKVNLPNEAFVFCCFNSQYKITPTTFAGWMRILKATKDSVLWLLENNTNAAKNLKKEANKFGISEDRLIFAQKIPNDQHLKRIQLADLFIDTFPYNAHTTASDALRMNLPVLTLIGNSFTSRVGASLLNTAGIPEMITTTQNEYELLAINLAKNPNKLKDIKNKLINNLLKTPLFDIQKYTKNLERAYSIMHKNYQKGLNPKDIKIES